MKKYKILSIDIFYLCKHSYKKISLKCIKFHQKGECLHIILIEETMQLTIFFIFFLCICTKSLLHYLQFYLRLKLLILLLINILNTSHMSQHIITYLKQMLHVPNTCYISQIYKNWPQFKHIPISSFSKHENQLHLLIYDFLKHFPH